MKDLQIIEKNKSQCKACRHIAEECINCGNCVAACQLLQRIGEDPGAIALREPSAAEAYACSLCRLCRAVCPVSLCMGDMFAETRENAVKNGSVPIDDYRYMFPDRKNNMMSYYRKLNGVDYSELNPDSEAAAAFFPGCTLMTYSPELTGAAFRHLSAEYPKITLITDCCGLPLFQMGLRDRGLAYVRYVIEKLHDLKVKKLITACPNCYYHLKKFLEDSGLELLTVYEALEKDTLFSRPLTKPAADQKHPAVTIHDSCPDRFSGIFGRQVRTALARKGYTLAEMDHHGYKTLCCGSGGQVSHFQPDLSESLTAARLREAEKTGAEILAAYCLSCTLNFTKKRSKFKVRHALDLLLEMNLDYDGIKEKAKKMFSGPEGEKYWEEVMAEEN